MKETNLNVSADDVTVGTEYQANYLQKACMKVSKKVSKV